MPRSALCRSELFIGVAVGAAGMEGKMKRIIEGKRYNTETAEEICELPCTAYRGDFAWHKTSLYRTPRGAFFLSGEGNASSMWATAARGGGRGPGEGIRAIDADQAREILEREGETDALERFFTVEDA